MLTRWHAFSGTATPDQMIRLLTVSSELVAFMRCDRRTSKPSPLGAPEAVGCSEARTWSAAGYRRATVRAGNAGGCRLMPL